MYLQLPFNIKSLCVHQCQRGIYFSSFKLQAGHGDVCLESQHSGGWSRSFVSLRPAWDTQYKADQPRLHGRILPWGGTSTYHLFSRLYVLKNKGWMCPKCQFDSMWLISEFFHFGCLKWHFFILKNKHFINFKSNNKSETWHFLRLLHWVLLLRV